MGKSTPASAGDVEMWLQSLGQEDPLEEGMAAHSSILAWRIPWTKEPSSLQSIGPQRVWHDSKDLAHTKRIKFANGHFSPDSGRLFPCEHIWPFYFFVGFRQLLSYRETLGGAYILKTGITFIHSFTYSSINTWFGYQII